jgi:hypothetical protein
MSRRTVADHNTVFFRTLSGMTPLTSLKADQTAQARNRIMRQKVDRGDTPIETNLARAYRAGHALPDQFREVLARLQVVLEDRLGDGNGGGHPQG